MAGDNNGKTIFQSASDAALSVYRHPVVRGFLVGGLSTCGAVTFTNPLEVVKTRMQLQGELGSKSRLVTTSASNLAATAASTAAKSAIAPKPYTNVFQAFFTIIRHEGLYGIQRGLVTAYWYQLAMNGTRLGVYEPIKRTLLGLVSSKEEHHSGIKPFYIVNVLSGATAGMLGAAVGSPLFLVKTRLQAESSYISVGHQHHLPKGVWRALWHIFRHEGGLSSLYRGVDVAMLRTAVGSAVQLSTYDQAKSKLVQYGIVGDHIGAHFLASCVSGLMVCIFMTPLDMLTTRMYNQPSDPNTGRGALYKNPIDCFVKTVKTEGFFALYKGTTASFLRIGPHTVLTLVFFELLKKHMP